MSTAAKKAVEPSGVPAQNEKGKVVNLPTVKTTNELAADRLDKLDKFLKMRDTNDKLRAKQRKLADMLSGEDGITGLRLTLESNTEEVEISNSIVVKEVLQFAKSKLDAVVEASNNDVLTFEI